MKGETYYLLEDVHETYQELENKKLNFSQLRKVYDSVVDKQQYETFSDWFADMKKMSLCRLTY